MRTQFNQLTAHLPQSLASLYLIACAEPVLIQSAVSLIRQTAIKQQFTAYQWLCPSTRDEWEQLLSVQQNLSLFDQKQIIEIFLPGGKPGQVGAQYLQQLAKNLNPEQILLITLDKIDKALLSSRWVTQCEQAGVLIPIWPLNAAELTLWLDQQSALLAVKLSPAAKKILLSHTQGNLTAVMQALQQLSLYPQPIDVQQLNEVVSDQAQYAINDYIQLLFSNKLDKSLTLLQRLQAQEVEPTWIIWQIAQYVRNQLNAAPNANGIWKKAIPLLHELDAVTKGNALVSLPWPDPWSALRHFTFKLQGNL